MRHTLRGDERLFPDNYCFGIFRDVEIEGIDTDAELDFGHSHDHRSALDLCLHLAEVVFVFINFHYHLVGSLLLYRFSEGNLVILAIESDRGGLVESIA